LNIHPTIILKKARELCIDVKTDAAKEIDFGVKKK
jgi:hypothetical protein